MRPNPYGRNGPAAVPAGAGMQATLGGRTRAYGEAVLRWRWPVIVLTLLVALASGYGVRFLSFDPDSRQFFGPDDPGRRALDHLEDTYTRAGSVLFVLAPKNGDVFTRETLAVIEDLTERAWRTPYSSRVESLTDYQHSYAEGDDLVVEDLVESAEDLSDAELARVRRIALSRPELVDRMVSPDGDVTAVAVEVINPGEARGEVTEVAAFARGLADELRREHPEVDVYLTGSVLVDITFAEAAQRDLATLVPLMAALIVATLAIGLGTAYGTLATVLVVALSVITALGLAGWAGVVLNGVTAGTPVAIMTLAVADCVHILSTLRQRYRPGADKVAAIAESLRVNASPIAITGLTTVTGFMILNFGEAPPLREFGTIVAFGVLAACVYSVTFFPAMLAVLPLDTRARSALPAAAAVMNRLADFVIARRRWLLAAGPVVVLVLVAGITRLTLDDDFVRAFDESFEFRTDTDFTQKNLTGLNALEFSVPAGEEYGVVRPDYLAKLDAFAEWFRQQDGVKHVTVLTDTLKRLNQNMHGDDPAFYRLPESRELAAQYLLLYEMSLPFGHDLNNRIDVAKSATRVTVRLDEVSSAEVRELAARGEAWLRDHAPEMAAPATGLSVIYAYMTERNIRSMLRGNFVGLLLISGCLLLVLRSVRIGLISLAPNLVPAAMAFGLWGYLVGEVNLAVSVVGAMTLGIVVDDTVHILTHYLQGRREHGMDAVAAVRYSLANVGVPVVVTTVALCVGFGVLAMSGFAVASRMGVLSAITIVLALVADLLFLPPLLMRLERQTS